MQGNRAIRAKGARAQTWEDQERWTDESLSLLFARKRDQRTKGSGSMKLIKFTIKRLPEEGAVEIMFVTPDSEAHLRWKGEA